MKKKKKLNVTSASTVSPYFFLSVSYDDEERRGEKESVIEKGKKELKSEALSLRCRRPRNEK